MVENDDVFSNEYAMEKSTDTSSETIEEKKEEKVEEEALYNIAKPKRRYIRGIISKDED